MNRIIVNGGVVLLPFFTDPYPDELIYSAIGRYHFYSGNIKICHTPEELFGNETFVPSVEFGNHLSSLVQNLGAGYSVDKILSENTIYPFFSPFFTREKQEKIIQDISDDASGLHGRLGILPSKVNKKKGIFFCRECVIEDIKLYGEPYLHREHHLPAIYYCPHHEQALISYPVNYKVFSRNSYIRLDKRIIDSMSIEEDNDDLKEYKEIQIKLSKMAYELLQLPLQSLSLEVVFKKYRKLLRENNWILKNTAVNQEELLKAFNSKFPKGFLEKFNSEAGGIGANNWLQNIVENYNRQGVHPFRHLLLLYFFDQDIDSFLEVKEDEGPFGKGPWPCLNVAANHYRELIISEVSISKRPKTDVIIGSFKCSCGFEYNRTGPEKDESEKWIKSCTRKYGELWEGEFDELLNQNMRIKDIALALEVSESTVRNKISVKNKSVQRTEEYRIKLLDWLEHHPNGDRQQFQAKFIKVFTYLYHNDTEWLDAHFPSKRANMYQSREECIETYRELLLNEIKETPSITRKQLWNKFNRACKFIYANDLEWYETNMPKPIKSRSSVSTVDWEARDEGYFQKIKKIHPDLLSFDKPIRISRNLIGKHLGMRIFATKKILEKIPKTNALLDEITESIQEFRIRRCCLVIDKMLDKNGVVYFEKVREECAIESKSFKKIKPFLEEYITKKQEEMDSQKPL